MSSDEQNEHFCDGITEEILNALAKIESLKVTSRTSSFHFKNKELPIPEIGKALSVTTILEGSVRVGGDMLRITAQLIQAEEDFHFWSETWDRKLENIFEIQDEISLLIADKIREDFGHFEIDDHLVIKQTDNINAYEHSLLGNFHKNKWNAEDCEVALDHYDNALDLDPNHVPSIMGKADVYSFLGMTGNISFMEGWQKCHDLIERALEIDPNNPEAHYQKGHSAFFTECDFAKAFELGSKAIKLRPNYVEAQQFMSFLNLLSGNINAAKEHLDIALGIDPLSQETLFFKAHFDYVTRNYEESLSQLDTCLEVNPMNIPALSVKPLCLIKLGRYDEVITFCNNVEDLMPKGERLGATALVHALRNDSEKTAEFIELFKEKAKSPDGFTLDAYVFTLYVVTGQIDKAFDWVESAIERKASLLMLRYTDPMVDALRSDERYDKYFDIIFPIAEPKSTPKTKKALLDEDTAEEYRSKLLEHIDENESFLNPDLSLRSLAEQLSMHPNQLSWLLNEKVGKSFNAFINSYRIERFKELALNPDNAQYSIIGLAYDSGFNSKTVFNTYFKKSTGQSPKAWMKVQ